MTTETRWNKGGKEYPDCFKWKEGRKRTKKKHYIKERVGESGESEEGKEGQIEGDKGEWYIKDRNKETQKR